MSYGTEKLSEEKVFKDPIHNYIHVRDRVIWDVIGTREFQRLRRIRQLGTTYLVFHGAEHSRFQHSLGVYEIVRRIVDDVFAGRPEWDASERLVTLCAALLHDVGHGPFSHAFENVFDLDHEQFTREIILGPTEVNDVLSRVSSNFPKQVAEVIEKTYPNKLVISLVSSQIDADRMDYLQRDSFYTGVSYGHFDMERILRVMRPTEEEVVIKTSGMHAVEDYIMSRYQMYWQVYFHPTSRSAEVILTKALHRAKQLYEEEYPFEWVPKSLRAFFEDRVTVEDYVALDESVLVTAFHMWQQEADPILSDLSDRFLNRRLFQYIDFNPATEYVRFGELERLFREAGLDPDYYLVALSSSDLPYDLYRPGEENERVPIQLIQPDGNKIELSKASDIVQSISGKRRTSHKLYFPEDVLRAGKEEHPLYERILNKLGSGT